MRNVCKVAMATHWVTGFAQLRLFHRFLATVAREPGWAQSQGGRGNPVAEECRGFGALGAPQHVSPLVTRESAMWICAAERHIVRHGSAASRDGYARSPAVRKSVGSAGGTTPC
jgi:hypothetical protein